MAKAWWTIVLLAHLLIDLALSNCTFNNQNRITSCTLSQPDTKLSNLDSRTTTLRLSLTGTGTFAPQHHDLHGLTSLQELHMPLMKLSNAQFEDIDFFGDSMRSLRVINLDENMFDGDMRWLCDHIGDAAGDISLSLRDNPFNNLQLGPGCNRLVSLDITGSNAESTLFTASLTNASLMQTLRANWPASTTRGDALIVGQIPQLRTLEVANRDVVNLTHCVHLPTANLLTSINFANSNIQYIDQEVLYRALSEQAFEDDLMLAAAFQGNPSQCRTHPDLIADPRTHAQLSCDCVDPPFRNASHCPRVAPIICNDGTTTIAATEICDEIEQCPGGEDESNCRLSLQLDGPQQCAVTVSNAGGRGTFINCSRTINLVVRDGIIRSTRERSGKRFCAIWAGVAVGLNNYEMVHGVAIIRLEVLDHYAIIYGRFGSVRREGLQIQCNLRYVRTGNPPSSFDRVPDVDIVSTSLLAATCANLVRFGPAATTTVPLTAGRPNEAPSSASSSNLGVIIGAAVGAAVVVTIALLLLLSRRKDRQQSEMQDELLTTALDHANNTFANNYGHAVGAPESVKMEFGLMRLQASQLKLGKVQGHGRFGRRYRATYVDQVESSHDDMTMLITGSPRESLTPQAEKDKDCQVLTLEVTKLAIYEEFLVMCRLHHFVSRRHPHILAYHGHVLDETRPMCVIEWTQHGSMRNYLQQIQRRNRAMTLSHFTTIFRQVSSAMAHLEALGIVHRQLCMENVFVGRDHNHVKVTGFSMARDVYRSLAYVSTNHTSAWTEDDGNDSDDVDNETIGIRYYAPESLQDDEFTLKSDVYAFAVFMHECFNHGQYLHADLTRQELLSYIQRQSFVPDPEGTLCDDFCRQLIRRASFTNPDDRLTFEGIFSQLWGQQASRYDVPQAVLNTQSLAAGRTAPRYELIRLNEEIFRTPTAVSQHAVAKGPEGAKPVVVLFNPMARQPTLSKGWTAISHVLTRFEHPNVQPCAGKIQIQEFDTPVAGLVFADREGLLDYILRVNVPDDELCRLVCVDVLAGLQHLSARSVACKSIKLENLVVDQQRLQLRGLDAMLIQEASDCNLDVFANLITELPSELGNIAQAPKYHKAVELTREIKRNQAINGFQRIAALLLHFEDMFSDGKSTWELDWDDLQFVKVLGSGNFGQVNLMELTTKKMSHHRFGRSSGNRAGETMHELVAVKTLVDKDKEDEFLQEMNMMKQLSHPNLVSLLHVITRGEEQGLILEYLELGALSDWLIAPSQYHVPLQDLAFIAHQVACGMSELANLGIVHRDLAARNVLLGEGLIAKVADFGLSRNVGMSHNAQQMYYKMQTNQPLAVRWVAPEMIPTQKASPITDVYSFGMLLFELFTRGSEPFADKEDKQVLHHLRILCKQEQTDKPAMRFDDPMPEGIRNMIYKCISLLPAARPTFAKLVMDTLPHCWKQLLKQDDTSRSSMASGLSYNSNSQAGTSASAYQPLTAGSMPLKVGQAGPPGQDVPAGYAVLTQFEGTAQEESKL